MVVRRTANASPHFGVPTRLRETKSPALCARIPPKPGDVEKNGTSSAADVILGRLAAAALCFRGKHKPQFAPNEDCGDYVVIINADRWPSPTPRPAKVRLPPLRPPGWSDRRLSLPRAAGHRERAVEKATKGMVPHTKKLDAPAKKLKVYAGADTTHASQNPKPFEITQVAQ